LTTDGSGKPVYGGCTGTALALNTWTHLVAVSDGSGSCALYQNGVKTSAGGTGVTFGTTLNIGGSSFTGSIDDFKLYHLALTADQVKADYNQGAATVMGASSTASSGAASFDAARSYCPPGDIGTCNPPVGEWKLDEGSGQSTADSSGNSHPGTLGSSGSVDSADPAWATGKIGKGLRYKGVDVYVDVGTTDFGIDNSFTVGFWMNYSQPIGGGGTIGTAFSNRYNDAGGGSNGGFTIGVYGSSNKIAYRVYNGTAYLGSSYAYEVGNALSPNQWYYVTSVYNGSNIYTYVNGSLTDTTAYSDLNLGNFVQQIGANYFNSDWVFNGFLDEFKIYNYARTPAQIAWDFNRGDPITQYDLDECQGSTVYNSVVNANGQAAGYNGTIYPGTSDQTSAGDCSTNANTLWYNGRTGKYNSSLNFDGTDDYVDLSSHVSTLRLTSGSISVWFKSDNVDERDVILGFGDNDSITEWGAFDVGPSTITYDDESLSFVNRTSTYQLAMYVRNGHNAYLNNQWHHAVVIVDGIENRIYIDGVKQNLTFKYGSSTTGGYFLNTGSEDSMALGRRFYLGSPEYYNGQIDDVRIYNYALSDTQVKTLLNNNSAVSFSQ
jgi:hypothetical protein